VSFKFKYPACAKPLVAHAFPPTPVELMLLLTVKKNLASKGSPFIPKTLASSAGIQKSQFDPSLEQFVMPPALQIWAPTHDSTEFT
jgi:hypothetical protein